MLISSVAGFMGHNSGHQYTHVELEPILETLTNVINKIPQNLDLLITGDFNIRIGVIPDSMPNDKYPPNTTIQTPMENRIYRLDHPRT